MTTDTSLPPFDPEKPRREIVVTISVPDDWESRGDMQWCLEREIHADRWRWNWADVAEAHRPSCEKPNRITFPRGTIVHVEGMPFELAATAVVIGNRSNLAAPSGGASDAAESSEQPTKTQQTGTAE
jgi:hypothetical protein